MTRDVIHTGLPGLLLRILGLQWSPSSPEGRDFNTDPDTVNNPLLRGPCVPGRVRVSSLYPPDSYALLTQRQRMSSDSI